ncbi:hypothetical protein L2E82_32076 [Cichorium intybus]|uniref:Uncharacterized protein n=1 Tax=Cichorium intybus TaxID=13427 RepID=A0ACB9BF04_CICIN|nr:hypothetical protein L2E82_32076 [Cichorium intybus]
MGESLPRVQEFRFFKVVNHGVPMKFINKLESEVVPNMSSDAPVVRELRAPEPPNNQKRRDSPAGDLYLT